MRTPVFMARVSVLVGLALLACQAASARIQYWAPTTGGHHVVSRSQVGRSASGAAPVRSSFSPMSDRAVHLTAYEPSARYGEVPTLSRAAWYVSQIAARNGDRNYLMVDKTRGELILFANGAPIFTRRALTGASLADQLPSDAMSKTYAQEYDVRYRVTPARRFTLTHGFDKTLGTTLDINEIKGKDWTIAIHASPSPRRGAWLRTASDWDRHVTQGCINVEADAMRELLRLLPRQGHVPLYILPTDERLISRLF